MDKEKKNKIIVYFTTVFILLAMMFITSRSKGSLTFASNVTGIVLKPVNIIVSFTKDKAARSFEYVFGSFTLRKELKELRQENAVLKENIAKAESVMSREEFLKNEYNLLKTSKYKLQEAYVISKDSSNYFINFTIDKGSSSGVKTGDIIVQGAKLDDDNFIEAIVGRVTEVGTNWARVSSVIDEVNSIAFKNSRNSENGIINGKGERGLSGYSFNVNADLKLGDTLLTTGVGGVYPRDLYIGQVTDVKLNEELVTQVIVESKVNFGDIYRVLILDKGEGEYE